MKGHLALLTLLAFLLISSFVAGAYGHGLGSDQSLPVTIGNRQVAVEALLKPAFIEQVPGGSPTFTVRAFDPGSNATIAGVDYRIAVQLKGETLLDQRFRSPDGVVLANLVPDETIDGWQIAGESVAPEQQVAVSQGNPVELRSRMLAEGGLYHVAVTIEQGSSGLQVPADRKFDLYISIARSFTFDIEGGQDMVVKTYYDDVRDFSYDNGTISFAMPFSWQPAYIDQVPLIHMEVQFPKSLEKLQTNSYRGTLNGQELGAESIQIDDYALVDDRTVHFVISNSRLERVAESVEDSDVAVFTLAPAEKPKFPFDLMSAPGEKYLLQLSWGPELIETGSPTTFVMNIQDPATGELVRGSSFDFVLTQNGQEMYRQRLASNLGTYAHEYTFSRPGTVTLSAGNINGGGETVKLDLVVLRGINEVPVPQPNQQPSGCLIATAAFGSELTPQVQYLRNFRENYILSTASGAAFMSAFNSVYYSFSPQVADYEREQPWLQSIVKAGLYPLFGILMVAEQAYSAVGGEAGAVAAGATASMLIGAVYLWPAGILASRKIRISNKLLAAIVGAAAVILAITLAFVPALLPFSTSAFVIAAAGASAIAVAKTIRRAYRQLIP